MNMIILAGLVVISVALIAYAVIPRKEEGEQERVRKRMAGGKSESGDDISSLRKQARESVTQKMVDKFAPIAVKPVMPQSDAEMSKLRAKLSNAGFRRDSAPTLFLASKTVLAIGFGLVALLVCYTKNMEMQRLFGYSIFAAGIAFMAPNIWLSMAVSKRTEQVRTGLPDGLDLMVIAVESGLGLDAAIQRVGDELKNVHPTLSEEFRIATWESQMGIPRSEALDNLAARTGLPEMKSLVGVVNQAEKFGTSIAKALRNQSDAQRVKRRQQAEEKAQKTTVKLMVPLILFIFPAILVVLAGPAALAFLQQMADNPNL